MSKRSARMKVDPRLITRKQQIQALSAVKGREVAEAVAGQIKEAVKSEVEAQLKSIKDTMLDCIDRVVALEQHDDNEGGSEDRQEGAEAVEVPEVDEVVPDEVLPGTTPAADNVLDDDASGGLLSQGT